MSEVNNHMDKVFREKLGNYSKDPPEEIWAAIRSETGKEPSRKLIFIAWRVAAGIAIIITAGYTYYYINHSQKLSKIENIISKQETVINQEAIDKTRLSGKSDIQESKSITGLPVKNRPVYRDKSGTNDKTKEVTGLSRQNLVDEKVPGEDLPVTGQSEKDFESRVFLSDLPYILISGEFQPDKIPARRIPALKNIININPLGELAEETTGKKDIWSLTAQVSPTYNYRNLSQGDPGSIASYNETESGKINYAGGLQLGFKATERLSFFTGLMYSQIGFEIKNVASYQANKSFNNDNLYIGTAKNSTNFYSFSNSTGFISSGKSKNNVIFSNNSRFSAGQSYSYSADAAPVNYLDVSGILNSSDKIDQYFQFIELPFMLRYKVLNRKLKMNLLGGLSTNVLIGNRVLLITDKNKSVVGETQGIRTINYTGNLGFGFDYDLGKNFLFTIEPQFRYYLNSINERAFISSRPYSIGMYTGIRYIF